MIVHNSFGLIDKSLLKAQLYVTGAWDFIVVLISSNVIDFQV